MAVLGGGRLELRAATEPPDAVCTFAAGLVVDNLDDSASTGLGGGKAAAARVGDGGGETVPPDWILIPSARPFTSVPSLRSQLERSVAAELYLLVESDALFTEVVLPEVGDDLALLLLVLLLPLLVPVAVWPFRVSYKPPRRGRILRRLFTSFEIVDACEMGRAVNGVLLA